MASLTSLLATRYIFSRRKGGFVTLIAWFSMLGIMLGVATLILVTSLMNGIRHEMLNNFIGLDGHIMVQQRGKPIADVAALMQQIQPSLPSQAMMIPRIEGQVMMSGRAGTARGAQVLGLEYQALLQKKQVMQRLTPEMLHAFQQGEGVIIGARMAEALGVSAGDAVTLISPQGRATAIGSVPRIKAYPVIGVFEIGMHSIDASLVFMPYDVALTYFAMTQAGTDPATTVEITLPIMDEARIVSDRLQQQLGQSYLVLDWQRVHESVFTALLVQRNVMVIILALIIVVAAFNIISSLVMLVKDKRSDIAILRTMGMGRRAVIGLFVLTGMSIGMIGTFLGLGLGLLAATYLERIKQAIEAVMGQKILVENIYFLSTLPTRTDPFEVMAIVLIALFIAFCATLYPAYHAASLDPADSLRHGG
jgi:lipoprotein-releasing system permease protein